MPVYQSSPREKSPMNKGMTSTMAFRLIKFLAGAGMVLMPT